MKAQQFAGLPRKGYRRGLCGLSLWGCIIVPLIFRRRILSAIKFQNRTDPDFPDALFSFRLLAGIFPAAQLTFHLHMRAFGQCLGEFREPPKDNATMPLGMRDLLAAVLVLVGGLCGKREGGKAAVVRGANFCIVA